MMAGLPTRSRTRSAAGAVPAAAGTAAEYAELVRADRRQPRSQRRGDPARRRHPHGPALNPSRAQVTRHAGPLGDPRVPRVSRAADRAAAGRLVRVRCGSTRCFRRASPDDGTPMSPPTRAFAAPSSRASSLPRRRRPPASCSVSRLRSACVPVAGIPRVARSRASSTQLPVALPALVLAFGFVLVFSSDTLPWLGSLGLLVAGHDRSAFLISCTRCSRTCDASACARSRTPPSRSARHGGSASSSSCCRRVRHSVLAGLIVVVGAVDRRIPVFQPRRGLSQSHVSGRARCRRSTGRPASPARRR